MYFLTLGSDEEIKIKKRKYKRENGPGHCLSSPGERRQMVLPMNTWAPERHSILTQVEGWTVLGPES